MADLKVRDSGIELLKILAMMLIVLFHVIQTLSTLTIDGMPIFDFTMTGQGVKIAILSSLWYNGNLGNMIFFICSAWFLIDRQKADKKKILTMILDIWVISFIFILITSLINCEYIEPIVLIHNLLPTTYQNNWYTTCYILFYAMHPLLNKLINNMNQVQHFRVVFAMTIIYFFIRFFMSLFGPATFWGNSLVAWIVVYFVIAYMKRYMPKLSNNIRTNVILLAIGVIGHLALIFGTNALKHISGIFIDKMLYWNNEFNPFVLLISVSLLNIARSVNWKNETVNYISSLTLYIYLIHENCFVRTYFRPYLWKQIFNNYGQSKIFMWISIMSLSIFIISAFISAVYKATIHKSVVKFSEKIYDPICLTYKGLEKKLMKLN